MRTLMNAVVFLMVFLASHALAQDVLVTPYTALQMPEQEECVVLAFSGDGKFLLSGDTGGTLQCWDLERRIPIAAAKLKGRPLFLAFLTGDRSYVAVDETGTVCVVDLLKGAAGTTFQTKGDPVRLSLDAGKQYLAIATASEQIKLFDLKALMPAGTIDARNKIEDILFLGFDRLAQQIVAIMPYGDVVAWNPGTLKPIRELSLAGGELHGSRSVVHSACTNRATNIFAVALEEVAIPKGGALAARDLERRSMIIAYDWNTGIEIKRLKTVWNAEQMVLGPGSDHVTVINDENKAITLVDLRKGELGSSVTMELKPRVLSVSEDNRWLAAGGDEGWLAVWKLQYRGDVAAKATALPSLTGRIRTRSGTEPALKPENPVKMAILSFEAKGVPQDVADVCLTSMSNALANFDYITLVERRQIETIVKEQQFQLSGLTEEEGVKVGRLLRADVVLLGSVGRLGTSLVLSARLISMETGKVIKGREVICEECRDQDVYDAISMLVSTVAQ